MNLFTFHYITNCTLSIIRIVCFPLKSDCKIHTRSELLFEVATKIIVTGERKAVKCPFKQPSEHPHPSGTWVISVLLLSLWDGCHTERLKAPEKCSLQLSLYMYNATAGMRMGFIKPCSRSIMTEGSTFLWDWREERVKGVGKSIC